jgi:hypothetical protein
LEDLAVMGSPSIPSLGKFGNPLCSLLDIGYKVPSAGTEQLQ